MMMMSPVLSASKSNKAVVADDFGQCFTSMFDRCFEGLPLGAIIILQKYTFALITYITFFCDFQWRDVNFYLPDFGKRIKQMARSCKRFNEKFTVYQV